ncbi:MAG: hypothetical protein ACP5M4_08750 [Acidobacteriaceae bacterium]
MMSSTPTVLSQLTTKTTIGSTVDPTNGGNNPYGLAIAPATSGLINAGDLIVCNFNDKAGTSGAGTTIEDLAPTANSTPKRIAQDPSLAGCDALALGSTDSIWAAAYTANDNPIVKPTGTVATTLATSFNWQQPWGQIFAVPSMSSGITANPTFYVSQAGNGSIVAVEITSTGFVYKTIATGFPTAVSATYGILAPAGLTYDPNTDTLYIVSSDTNSVVAISKVSTVPENGITVSSSTSSGSGGSYGSGSGSGSSTLTFSGPAASQAKVIASGSPLNYPVSSALLYNGDLIVGNTGDNNMVEINPTTDAVIGTETVDSGKAGAIFGIATEGTTLATQKVFFNDDNTNTVVELSQ